MTLLADGHIGGELSHRKIFLNHVAARLPDNALGLMSWNSVAIVAKNISLYESPLTRE